MKRYFLLLLLAFTLSTSHAQNSIAVELPEAYELSNIILALTPYGQEDPWEVQKNTHYYKELMDYFAPVKDHPLLLKVNYSREKWKDYLSFRTDAYAFAFDADGVLRRKFSFFANRGYQPFDDHLDLVNDFVRQSKFREFYKTHTPLYQSIITNYKEYYLLEDMRSFFEGEISKTPKKHRVVLSPLVYRMNCHRNIDSLTSADFAMVAKPLMVSDNIHNEAQRLSEVHTVFTEMDHGFVNPVSKKYRKEIDQYFDYSKWNVKSGYDSTDIFNEYMTWALYDVYLQKRFPQLADSLSIQWHYQNASRGFIASDLFAQKLAELYAKKKKRERLEDLYLPLLKWCSRVQQQISQPQILSPKSDSLHPYADGYVEMTFTEKMDSGINEFNCTLLKLENGRTTNEQVGLRVNKEEHQLQWMDEGRKLRFRLGDTPYEEFALILNWWGSRQYLYGRNKVMLKPQSYVVFKKKV